jgi:poly-beta-1,6-N-acetyl-D-glucosamine synthase
MDRVKYVVITPVRNEAKYAGATIASMVRQTLLPEQWVIVDDGSTDGTGDLIDAAARGNPWITAVRRPDRGFRRAGAGVVEAFYDGYAAVRGEHWEFIVKLDGDLTFEPNYFEACFAQFANDPRLGIGGGAILVPDKRGFKVDTPGAPPFHVRGATKIYRHACWNQISPLVRAPGWDTIDEVRANMYGWSTKTFSNVSLVQLRQTGSTDSEWRHWYKNGRANYITGYHPLFMLGKCLKRAFQRSPLAAAALCAGFCSGYVKRLPMVEDDKTIRYLRRQQLLRLLSRPSIYADATKTENAQERNGGSEDPIID